jgi:hypothetical protein
MRKTFVEEEKVPERRREEKMKIYKMIKCTEFLEKYGRMEKKSRSIAFKMY